MVVSGSSQMLLVFYTDGWHLLVIYKCIYATCQKKKHVFIFYLLQETSWGGGGDPLAPPVTPMHTCPMVQ